MSDQAMEAQTWLDVSDDAASMVLRPLGDWVVSHAAIIDRTLNGLDTYGRRAATFERFGGLEGFGAPRRRFAGWLWHQAGQEFAPLRLLGPAHAPDVLEPEAGQTFCHAVRGLGAGNALRRSRNEDAIAVVCRFIQNILLQCSKFVCRPMPTETPCPPSHPDPVSNSVLYPSRQWHFAQRWSWDDARQASCLQARYDQASRQAISFSSCKIF